MMFRFIRASLFSVCILSPACAQGQSSSAQEHAQCKFPDGKNVNVDYFSARMNGRKIFGSVVPFDKIWQTGFGKPTMLVTSANLSVGGKKVRPGSYTMLTVPGSDKWTLIVNKKTSGLHHPYKDEASELGRVDLLLRHMNVPVENFTIAFDQHRGGCVLNLRWENTEASVLVAEEK